VKTRVLQVDLAGRFVDQAGLGDYRCARVLLRYGVRVIGVVDVPIEEGLLLASDIRIAANESPEVCERLQQVVVEEYLIRDIPRATTRSWTVVVCTRDRTELLRGCLDSLVAATDPSGEIIVVDNAPSSEATARLVSQYPVRYVVEERRGLNRARMLGARLASGEIVIYADDDTIAEPGWIPAILKEFDDARVGAVTGLTLPYELDTQAQELFERFYGFGRGFHRRVFDFRSISPVCAGAVGSGGNMAFRKELILTKEFFVPDLDLGTPTGGGGDLYALYRILADGYRIVYAPDALNWHRHRRDLEDLRRTFYAYSTGGYSLYSKCLIEHREFATIRASWWWFRRLHLRELARTLARRRDRLPISVILAAFQGTFAAPFAYLASRRAHRVGGASLRSARKQEAA
jgi:GT2 family glycosyltransferase